MFLLCHVDLSLFLHSIRRRKKKNPGLCVIHVIHFLQKKKPMLSQPINVVDQCACGKHHIGGHATIPMGMGVEEHAANRIQCLPGDRASPTGESLGVFWPAWAG